MTQTKPLVLDVDGTFLRTDLLYESFWAGLGTRPFATLAALRHLGSPARLKAELAEIAPLRTDLLPVNPVVADLALQNRVAGREVVLASASDRAHVRRLAADYGLSERVFASDGDTNLKGARKAEALVAAYGEGGFDYAGDHRADLPVWERADNALVVGRVPAAAALTAAGRNVAWLPAAHAPRRLVAALRPHQWVKNLLLLLPLLAAHRFDAAAVFAALMAIVAFSAVASAIYIVNDLIDLEADRRHAVKCRRPFAAGDVPIPLGMAAAAALTVLAFGLAALLPAGFALVLVTYMVLSLGYSLRLKRMRWVDVTTLAALYTLRVVAGAAATQIEASIFMLIFVFPIFLTLGSVKRLTELALTTTDERLPGRGYGRGDRGDLVNVAGIGTVGALVIFFLYSRSDQAQALYPTTWLLLFVLPLIAIWMVRMVLLARDGRQDYDPILFALRDRLGIGLLLTILAIMGWAAGTWARIFGA